MRFLITMNMPSRAGGNIHQIIAEYPVDTLPDFVEVLQRNDFVVVEEFYKDADANRGIPVYYSVGHTAINHRYIGKIKIVSNNLYQKRGDYNGPQRNPPHVGKHSE